MFRSNLVPTLVLLAGIAACDRAPTDPLVRADGPRAATNISTVCTSASTPTGYVILSYGNSFSCGSGSLPNTKTIGLPGSPEVVCTGSSVPSGRVITAYGYYTSSCDPYANPTNSPRDRFTIKIPGSSEIVCNSSPIPSGYTIGTSTWTSDCDQYNEGYRGFNNARQINHT